MNEIKTNDNCCFEVIFKQLKELNYTFEEIVNNQPFVDLLVDFENKDLIVECNEDFAYFDDDLLGFLDNYNTEIVIQKGDCVVLKSENHIYTLDTSLVENRFNSEFDKEEIWNFNTIQKLI